MEDNERTREGEMQTEKAPNAAHEDEERAAAAAEEAREERADRKSHRTLWIAVVAFAVLLVGAGVAYSALAPAAEKTDLVASPDYRGESAGSSQGDAAKGGQGSDAQGGSAGSSQGGGKASSSTTQAPDFTAVDAEGREVTLADFRGKPVVLNFWASWCGPCQSEMPEFQSAYQEYGDEVTFLMVNMTGMGGETQQSAASFIESMHYSFPVYYDKNSSAARAYGVSSIPQTYFIDADGAVVARAAGAIGASSLVEGIGLITGA
ncbi:MAG: redoxin domain-containing protein [Eggerthellaceae bacterium]|nr:redoxin domain-containing protein [Eggerthellaceae bacterium]